MAAGRKVLVYSTEMANTDMVLGYDRQLMKNTGKSPALMRCGKLSATLTCKSPEKFSIYALGFDGSRRERLPVSVADGRLRIQIDTATLADGPNVLLRVGPGRIGLGNRVPLLAHTPQKHLDSVGARFPACGLAVPCRSGQKRHAVLSNGSIRFPPVRSQPNASKAGITPA